MLTKMMAAVVMTGALWVAGDAASQNLGCCFFGSSCCSPAEDCCYGVKSTEADCCSPPGTVCCDPPSDCCVGVTQPTATTPAAKSGCCSATK